MKMAGCWSTWWACEGEGRWVDKSRRRRGGSEGGKGTQSIIHLFDHFSPGHRERLATVERTTERCRDCLLLYIPETLYFQSTSIMYHKCLEVHPEDQGQVMWELGIDCWSDLFSLQSIGEPPSLMSNNLINEFNPTCVIWLTSIWCQTCMIIIQSELEVCVCVCLYVYMSHSQMLGKFEYGLPAKFWRLVGCTEMLSW